MKRLILFSLISIIYGQTLTQPVNNPPEVILSDDNDHMEEIVLANFSQMMEAIGTLSTSDDPRDPAILGPLLAKIGIGFMHMIYHVFKNPEFCINGDDDATRSVDYIMAHYLKLYNTRNLK